MKKAKILSIFIYAAAVIFIGIYSFYHPEYNWDILPYIASAYSVESGDTNTIHTKTFNEVKNKVDVKTYTELTSGQYREAMESCAKCFLQQLPFYKIKTLYVLLIYFLYKLNINILISTVLISIISYVLINLICFFWIRFIVKKQIIYVSMAIIFSIFPFLLNSASDSTPNMLSALIVLSAMYCLIIKKKLYPFLGLMLLSVIARPDNIILFFLLLSGLYFFKIEEIKAKKIPILLAFITGIVILFLIDIWAGNYSWKVLFEHSFGERIITPAEHIPVFNLGLYLRAFLRWTVMLKSSNFSAQLLIFLLTIYILTKGKIKKVKMNFDLVIVLTIGINILIHYFLYPIIEDNYFIAQYLVIDLIFIKTVIEKLHEADYPEQLIQKQPGK